MGITDPASLPQLIRLLGRHTGLHVDETVIERSRSGACNLSHTPMSYAKADQNEWLKGMLDKAVRTHSPKFMRWFDAMDLTSMLHRR